MMQMFLFLFLFLVLSTSRPVQCTLRDSLIYYRYGHVFPRLFRSFAGMSVTKSAYEKRIVKETGLSKECATCYGDAYICGWSNCKWPCVSAGHACNVCLDEYKCTTDCNECTGFVK